MSGVRCECGVVMRSAEDAREHMVAHPGWKVAGPADEEDKLQTLMVSSRLLGRRLTLQTGTAIYIGTLVAVHHECLQLTRPWVIYHRTGDKTALKDDVYVMRAHVEAFGERPKGEDEFIDPENQSGKGRPLSGHIGGGVWDADNADDVITKLLCPIRSKKP